MKKQPATISKQVSSSAFVVPAALTNIQPLSPPKPFPIAPLTASNPIQTAMTMTVPKVN